MTASPFDQHGDTGLRARVGANVRWSFVAELLGYALLYVTVIVQTRRLQPESFGLFTAATTIVLYAWLFTDAGTAFYGTRQVAAGRDRSVLYTQVVRARLVLGCLAAAVSTFVAFVFDIPWWLWLAALLYLATYAFYAPWALKGAERFKALAVGTFGSSISLFVGTVLFVRDENDAALAALVWAVSYGIGAATLIPALRSAGFRFVSAHRFSLRALLGATLPFAVTGIGLTTYHFAPLLLLKVFGDDIEVGLFSGPFRLVLSAGTATFVVQSAVFPVLTSVRENQTDFQQVIRLVGLALIPLGLVPAAICWILADELVELALGAGYAGSADVLRILAPLLFLYTVRNTARVSLLALHRERLLQKCIVVAPVVAIAAGLVLIPEYAARGAAWTLVAAEAPLAVATVGAAFWSGRAARSEEHVRRTAQCAP